MCLVRSRKFSPRLLELVRLNITCPLLIKIGLTLSTILCCILFWQNIFIKKIEGTKWISMSCSGSKIRSNQASKYKQNNIRNDMLHLRFYANWQKISDRFWVLGNSNSLKHIPCIVAILVPIWKLLGPIIHDLIINIQQQDAKMTLGCCIGNQIKPRCRNRCRHAFSNPHRFQK